MTELYEDIKTQPQGVRKTQLQKEHAEITNWKMSVCAEKRREETSLDQVL